jgi:hypothetical protein
MQQLRGRVLLLQPPPLQMPLPPLQRRQGVSHKRRAIARQKMRIPPSQCLQQRVTLAHRSAASARAAAGFTVPSPFRRRRCLVVLLRICHRCSSGSSSGGGSLLFCLFRIGSIYKLAQPIPTHNQDLSHVKKATTQKIETRSWVSPSA